MDLRICTILTVYLTGCILSYLALRKDDKEGGYLYTIGDRKQNMIISTLSFFALIGIFITRRSKNANKEAKW